MKIRQAQGKDMDRINELLYQVCMVHHVGRPDLFVQGKKYPDERLREIIEDAERTPILVAVDDADRVLGYAFCVMKQAPAGGCLTDIKSLYIDDLCVDEVLRGQHIGQALYEAVLDLARKRDCYNVTLNVWACNESAMKFYEKCGLKVQKIGMETIL